VTGALCVAAACRLPGTVASKVAAPLHEAMVVIEHPGGRIDVELRLNDNGAIERGALVRTARRIFEGKIIIPASVL
jgi:2-methylaconitate cis-trans-isomerase PrpF